MAYNQHNLSVLAYANGFTLWHYGTADDGVNLIAPGYFNAASDMLRIGDMMLANCTIGRATGAVIITVSAVTAGAVLVTSATPLPPAIAAAA